MLKGRKGTRACLGSENVDELKPVTQIQNTDRRPVLLIACTKDTEVPPDNTRRLQKANPEVQVWLRDSWEHFIVKDCDFQNVEQDKEYWDTILEFIEALPE